MVEIRKDHQDEANRLFSEAEHREEAGDRRGAFVCLLKAAKLGDPSCMVNLGNCYAAGSGTRKNLKEAARWYRAAYRRGHGSGANNLAVDLRNQGDIRGAIAWFERAIAVDWDPNPARLELAKTFLQTRNGGTKAAEVLNKVIASRKGYEEDREEAKALLQAIRDARGE